MIVDPEGALWIVDWGFLGYYPEYMEYPEMVDPRLMPLPKGGYQSWPYKVLLWKWKFFRLISTGFSGFTLKDRSLSLQQVLGSTRIYSSAKGPYSDDQYSY
jgi:hypothetical protein